MSEASIEVLFWLLRETQKIGKQIFGGAIQNNNNIVIPNTFAWIGNEDMLFFHSR